MSTQQENRPGFESHALRDALIAEAHARPFERLRAPVAISHLAFVSGPDGGPRDRVHISELCHRLDLSGPDKGATYLSVEREGFRIRWERHTEFSTITFYRMTASSEPFAEPAISQVPPDWLNGLPGPVMVAVHVEFVGRDATVPGTDALTRWFFGDSLTGSGVAAGAGLAWTDFQSHADGYGRILIHDRSLQERQAGRLIQRLLEIETYRLMALLALPDARGSMPALDRLESDLTNITERMAEIGDIDDENSLLNRLSTLSASVESLRARNGYRFAASAAYQAIVEERIGEIREERIEGSQTIREFMDRRLAPAMRTCRAIAARQDAVGERIARATALLRTRVDLAVEAQSRDLLRSMDQRARTQLRLQETVEGLSVVAVSYYALGLIVYALSALEKGGLAVDPYVGAGLALPPVVLAVWLFVRRLRRRVVKQA